MTTLKGFYFIKNLANGTINAEPHAQRPNPVGIRIVSDPVSAVVCGLYLSSVDSDLKTSLALQWVIEPVPDPGPWPLYKIFLAPANLHLPVQGGTQANENISQGLGLKPANEVKEALYVVNGIQPDYWYIFPLKPQEPNIYASVSWHVVTTKTECAYTPVFDQDLQEADRKSVV